MFSQTLVLSIVCAVRLAHLVHVVLAFHFYVLGSISGVSIGDSCACQVREGFFPGFGYISGFPPPKFRQHISSEGCTQVQAVYSMWGITASTDNTHGHQNTFWKAVRNNIVNFLSFSNEKCSLYDLLILDFFFQFRAIHVFPVRYLFL